MSTSLVNITCWRDGEIVHHERTPLVRLVEFSLDCLDEDDYFKPVAVFHSKHGHWFSWGETASGERYDEVFLVAEPRRELLVELLDQKNRVIGTTTLADVHGLRVDVENSLADKMPKLTLIPPDNRARQDEALTFLNDVGVWAPGKDGLDEADGRAVRLVIRPLASSVTAPDWVEPGSRLRPSALAARLSA